MFISATTSLPLSLHTDIHAQHGGVGVEGGGGGWGGLGGGEGEVPGINNRSPRSLDKSKARRSQLLLLRRMRPPRMLFGVRASRVGSYVQQAQTAKRFAKDKVCRGSPHPSAGRRRHTIHRTRGRSLRHPRHAGSPPPSPPSAAPSPAAPGEARQGEAAGGPSPPGGAGAAGAWRSAACPRPRSARRLRRWAQALRKEKTLPPER